MSSAITHLCPFRDETDHGFVDIEIILVKGGDGPELYELRVYLDGFRNRNLTHEQVTAEITSKLEEDGWVATVTTHWTTAGMDIEVTEATPLAVSDDAEH